MRPALSFLLLLSIVSLTLHAQDRARPSLKPGDPAPPLRLRAWLKGAPIENVEKGKVYVLEFWATWCAPCRNNMPRLSVLAKKFSGKVTIAGIGVYEEGIDNFKKVKTFVDSMGSRMDYAVASEDSNFMATGWLNAFGESAIPHAFVVNAAGQVPGQPRSGNVLQVATLQGETGPGAGGDQFNPDKRAVVRICTCYRFPDLHCFAQNRYTEGL